MSHCLYFSPFYMVQLIYTKFTTHIVQLLHIIKVCISIRSDIIHTFYAKFYKSIFLKKFFKKIDFFVCTSVMSIWFKRFSQNFVIPMLKVWDIIIDYFQVDWTSFTYSMATSAKANIQKIACKNFAIFFVCSSVMSKWFIRFSQNLAQISFKNIY